MKNGEIILGIHCGPHDSSAALFRDYDLLAAIQLERLTRKKGDGNAFPDACIDEVLSIAGLTRQDVDAVIMSRMLFEARYCRRVPGIGERLATMMRRSKGKYFRYVIGEIDRTHSHDYAAMFDFDAFRRDYGFRPDTHIGFANHHECHALPTLFYGGWQDALLVTADGGGDKVNYSHRHFSNGEIKTIYGGNETDFLPKPVDSLGRAYSAATLALGFRPNRHEGKLTGLAAFGNPVFYDKLASFFDVDENGRVHSRFRGYTHMKRTMASLAKQGRREDVAASIQKVVEDVMLRSVGTLLKRYPSRNLGLAGGLFANVKLNRLLAESFALDEIFVFPAMGDEGLTIGAALFHLLERDGMPAWLRQRRPLGPVLLGRDYTEAIDQSLAANPLVRLVSEDPLDTAADRLAAGEIGAIYTGRMEFGPRALGARSILANPSRRDTHDVLNDRLSRTEFMPFAPVVMAEKAAEVFDVTPVNARACDYMTIATDVHEPWRKRIAAVVHVDGSARPQIIRQADNPLYHGILQRFEAKTGLPVLVNTSFNVHEEPIVNTPAECARALTDGRIDFVVTTKGVYQRVT